MDFYITPDRKEECQRKIEKMFKHFSQKPTVTFSEVEQVKKITMVSYTGGTAEENGCSRYQQVLDAIKVSIDNIIAGEWTLVASVYYQDKIVTIVNHKLFKDIPSIYGLEYTKCDYCGNTHSNRKESHILYNNNTHQWMQVGSACVEKMIPGGKYLNNLMLKLSEFIKISLGGCDDIEWHGGCWMPADKYWQKAVKTEDAIMLVKSFREDNPIWVKREYDSHGNLEKEGSSDYLREYVASHLNEVVVDNEYIKLVSDYVHTLEGGYTGWNNLEPTMNQKMIDAFDNGYITVGEMYLAFFAQKGYEDSLTKDEFAKEVEAKGIVKGEKYTFSGKVLDVETLECDDYVPYYDWRCRTTYLYTLKDDATGFIFEKEVGSKSVMDAFLSDDGTYKFKGTIKYIAYKKQKIGFGGRLSKVK